MKYKILWTDMHSNLHHEDIALLPKWFEHIKEMMDFWPFVYYPFYMRKDQSGLSLEDYYPLSEIRKDWEYIREFTDKVNRDGYPMFMGYEWQGAGLDGDHNVFFKNNDLDATFPLRYTELAKNYEGKDVIGLPHHLAYQLGHRGKNWQTHDERFSPLAEIYSSHGCSENDNGSIEMNRHIHMGPRTGETCIEQGWQAGHRFGVFASGDNHSCPGVYGFGYCAVLATSNSKEDIWDALVNRRVYAVSKDRIEMDYTIDDQPMGAVVAANEKSSLKLHIKASNAIDRIEILTDNSVTEMIPHTSTWERKPLKGKIRFKFQLELGWGPDRRIFPDIDSRKWIGRLTTPGKLLTIEKCWSTFGQKLYNVGDNSCDFALTTYKSTASGRWMGPSAVTTEGFIFEIEDDIDSSVTLTINDKDYILPIRDILQSSRLFALIEESEELIRDTFDFTSYYRSDPWWHNAYKIKVNQGAPSAAYERSLERTIDTTQTDNIRIRVWQRNGAAAWSSPIFIKR